MASSYGGGGGAGGKARKTSSRKPSTPYERPSAAGRGFSNSSEQSNSKGWLSKIVDPASKIIANGATRFFASVFQKRLTAPPVPLPENDNVGLVETNSEPPVQVKEGPHEEAECREVNQATFSKNDSVDELEKMLTNKTLSRDDFNRLTQLLQSRVVDSPVGNEIERHQLPASSNAKAQIAPPSKNATHEITENLVLDEMIASPTELAKAYMGSRSARESPTALRMNRRIYREVPSPRPLVPFVPMPNLSLSHKPALKFSGIYGTGADGYNAPGSRRSHSALFNPLPSPYLSSPRNEAFSETRNHQGVSRFASPSILQSSETPSSSKQALKRRGSFLDHDIGPASSMRRIRQKSNLISPFRGIGSQPASSVSLLPSGSNARPGSYANEKPLLLNSSNASSSLNARENVRDNQNSFASVPPQSAETARRILEEINKLVPSPKDKQDDHKSVIARDGAPSKLTLSMLSGKARRSMDEIDVSRFQDLQEENRFRGPGGPSLASPDESKAEIIGNGPAETSVSKAKSIKDATSRDKDPVAADTLSGLAKVSDSNGFMYPGIGHSFRMAVPEMEDDAENVMDLTASTFSEVSKSKPSITSEKFSGLKSEKKPVFNVSGFDSKKMQNGPVFPSAATPSEPIKPPPFSFIKPVETTRDSEGDSVISSGLPAPSIFQGFNKATPVSAVAENNNKTLGSGSILTSDSRNGLISEGHKTEMRLDNDVKVQKPGEYFPNSLPLFGSVPSSTSSGLGSLPPSVASTSALRVTTLSEVPGKSVQEPSSFSASLPVASNNQLGFGSSSPTLLSSASMSSNVVALSTAKPSHMPSPFGFSKLNEQPKQIGSFSSTLSSGASTSNAATEGTRLTNIAASAVSMNKTIKDQSNASSSSPLFGSVNTPALDTGFKPVSSSSIFSASSSAKVSLTPSSRLFSTSNTGSENPFGTSNSSLASSAFSSSTSGFSFGGSAGSGSSMLKFPFGGSSTNAASASIGFSSGESSASVPPSLATAAAAAASVVGVGSGLTASSLGVTKSSPLVMESTKRQPNVTTSSSNLFSFDNSSSSASSSSQVSFGQSSTTFSAPATTGFSFGLMSSGSTPSPATTGFTFGGSSQGASPSMFSFGSSSAAASSSPSMATDFSFASTSASGASSSVSTGYSFGGSSSSGLSSTTGYSFGSGAVSSPATAGFSFGGSSAGSSPFSFGSSSVATSSTGSLFSFTAAGSSSTPTFGFPSKTDSTAQPAMGFLSNSPGNDQMNVEDSMAEDTMQASRPTMPAFVTGSPAVGSIFGSPAGQVGASPVFPFGAPQGLPALQSSPNPFASPPANLDFSGGSFSLGANGGDKSGRRIFRAKRDKTRKK